MRTVLTTHDVAQPTKPYGRDRATPQRASIAGAVPDRAFTVAELAEAVSHEHPSIGLATVYRAVAAMERSGWLTRVGDVGGAALYARCAERTHHHHAVCTSCGRVEHTPCPNVAEAAAPVGFEVTSHELTLYGLCARCREGA